MKKPCQQRFTRTKNNTSFFACVARFCAAIPLCLLMLGGLSLVGFDNVLAASGSSGGGAMGTTDGIPLMGNWVLNNTDTGITPLIVGNGGDAAATKGGQGGSTTVTGTPAATADIVFNGAIGGNGGNGGSSAAGGNAGNFIWERTTMPLTVNSITADANTAGAGSDAATAMTTAGNGGASSGLTMNFGTQYLTLAGANSATLAPQPPQDPPLPSYAINLTAGSGGSGGNTYANSVSAAGNGGVGGDVSLTAGLLSITDNTGLAAAALFVAGHGGFAGNGPTTPDDVANSAAKSGDGGAGGNVNITLSGISFVSAGVPPGPDAPPRHTRRRQ